MVPFARRRYKPPSILPFPPSSTLALSPRPPFLSQYSSIVRAAFASFPRPFCSLLHVPVAICTLVKLLSGAITSVQRVRTLEFSLRRIAIRLTQNPRDSRRSPDSVSSRRGCEYFGLAQHARPSNFYRASSLSCAVPGNLERFQRESRRLR